MRLKTLAVVTSCLFIFSSLPLHAQHSISGIPQIINYTSANVKELTQTWTIKQDRKGVLYFGNSYGITIFDGKYWQLVRLTNNSAVRSMSIASTGVIYAGGMDEMGYLAYSPNGSVLYTSLLDKLPAQNRDLGVVKDIAIINDDIFFLSDRYLLIYHNNRFTVIKTETFFMKGYVVENRFFLMEQDVGLEEVKDAKLTRMPGTEFFIADPPVFLFMNTDSEITAVTANHGAFLVTDKLLKPVWPHLANLEITSGLVLRNKEILLGSIQKGLLKLDSEGKIEMAIDKNVGMENNNLLCFFVDCFDNLWAGHDNGVSYVEINNPFSYINEKIVSGAGYASLISENYLYLGTSQGLFATPLKTSSESVFPTFKLINGTEGRAWNLTKIDNTIFLGHDKGTFIIKNNEAKKINERLGGWNFQKLKSDPAYLIEGCYSGILLYKKEGDEWKYIRRINGFDESCRIFEQDDKGRIWVAHGYKGIFCVTLDAALTNASEVKFYGAANGFPSNLGINVFSIDNKLVFTSEHGGIYRYDEKSDRFVINTDLESYLGKLPKVSKLSEQPNGNIWVNEINRTGLLIKQSNGTFKYETQPFNKLKNALIGGFELFSAIPGDKTLFGFGSGFICYDRSKQKDYSQSYYTSIYKIELIASKDSVLFQGTNPIAQPKETVLDYKNNSLRFSFSAAYFEDMESIVYRYYLENFDDDWSAYTAKREREYTNLPEGTYTFHVKSRNLYDTESIESTFTFSVRPPWYRTWTAYSAYIILSVFTIGLLTRLYVSAHEKKLKRENLLKDRELVYLRNLKLHNELESKTKELGTLTTLVVSKNAVLQKIKEHLNELSDSLNPAGQKEIAKLIRQLDNEADMDKEWQFIEPHFDGVHFGFLSKLKEAYPALKANDLRLCAYIRMNLSSKEIAVLMNNTTHGVEAHRYRLRKIFKIDRKDNFKEFLNSI